MSQTTEISATLVKELREKTGAGIMDCKEALAKAEGDLEMAIQFLREKGLATAQKKAGRTATEGIVGSYVHLGGKIGVMVEVNCETDFVARNSDFQQLVKDVAMHIAAANPTYVRREEVPAETLAKEKEIYANTAKNENRPEKAMEKIVTGKLEKFLSEICLLEQPFVKNPDVTVGGLVTQLVQKTGENVQIRRFVRFRVGD